MEEKVLTVKKLIEVLQTIDLESEVYAIELRESEKWGEYYVNSKVYYTESEDKGFESELISIENNSVCIGK